MKTLTLRASSLLCLALAACPDKNPMTVHRVELRKLTGSTVEFVPTEGQMPYCMLFTISDKGVVRQLTMTRENKSVKCAGGQPIGGVSYKIPVDEGSVRAHIFFSDRKLDATSVAQQIYEFSTTNPKFSALDLRLPGEVKWETLEFTPSPDEAVQTGEVVGKGGTVSRGEDAGGGDAGSPAAASTDSGS